MPRLGALAPFRIRSYRFQWPADLLTSWAFEMETIILGWYVLVETNSVVMWCSTLISCSAAVAGASCLAVRRSVIQAIIGRTRRVGISSSIFACGTRRVIRTKISPRRLRCG